MLSLKKQSKEHIDLPHLDKTKNQVLAREPDFLLT
jgi:hypothetical protein